MSAYAQDGGIAPAGMSQDAYIQKQQQDAYNAAVANFSVAKVNYTASDYAQDQKIESDLQLQAAIDAYVAAASAVIQVVVVNNMAESITDINTAEGESQALEIQNYIAGNDVVLDDAEVLAYNDSLTGVEEAAAEMAAFTALAADAELQASLDASATELGVNLRSADTVYFSNGALNVEFASASQVLTVDMSGYFKTTTDILNRGATETFYQTGPTQDTCFFSQTQEEYDLCVINQQQS